MTASGGTSAGGAFAGPGGFNFRRSGTGGTSGTRPSFPAGSARRFAGGLELHRHRVGQGHRRQRLDGLRVGRRHFARGASPRPKSSSSKSSKTAKPVAPKTENLKITTSGSTTLTSTQSAAATDLAVGDCVTAFGPAATNGAVTATTVRITSTGGASCTGGFGGGGFFRGGGGGASRRRQCLVLPAPVGAVPGTGAPSSSGAIVLIVVLGGGAAAWAAASSGNSGYRMATVTRADIGQSMTVVGTVEPVNDASASFQVGRPGRHGQRDAWASRSPRDSRWGPSTRRR